MLDIRGRYDVLTHNDWHCPDCEKPLRESMVVFLRAVGNGSFEPLCLQCLDKRQRATKPDCPDAKGQ